MMLCDFHVHSTFSDGHLTIAQLVDFYGSRGFKAIAITDHLCEEGSFLGIAAHWLERTLTRRTFPIYLETLKAEGERALKKYGMRVIPGFELTKNSLVNHRSAHMVVLGIERYMSADQDIFQLLKEIKNEGGISIAAHPVSTGKFEPQTHFLWSQREELSQHFDAWEVASGKTLFPEVANSKLPMIANSDLHHPSQISSWKTIIHSENHLQAIFDSIRTQRLEFRYYTDPSPAKARYTWEVPTLESLTS